MSYTHRKTWRVYIGSDSSATTKSCVSVGCWWSEISNQSKEFLLQTHIKFGCTGLETKQLSKIAGKVLVVPIWLHRISQSHTKKLNILVEMPYFWFGSYRISNMSDRLITAQQTVLHTPHSRRLCLLVCRIEALYGKSQSLAHFCALCSTVLRLTPMP